MIWLLFLAAADVAPPTPAKTDDEIWAIARVVDTAEGYALYASRFPSGVHFDEADRAYIGKTGETLRPPPAPPAIPAIPPSIRPPVIITPSHCVALTYAPPLENEGADIKEFREVLRTNDLARTKAFVTNYADSICRQTAEFHIASRARSAERIATVNGFGPVAAGMVGPSIFTSEDYPVSALRDEFRGTTVARFDVAVDGVAENCAIETSSGNQAIDEATCSIIVRRGRFDPARDAKGVPFRSSSTKTVHWTL